MSRHGRQAGIETAPAAQRDLWSSDSAEGVGAYSRCRHHATTAVPRDTDVEPLLAQRHGGNTHGEELSFPHIWPRREAASSMHVQRLYVCYKARRTIGM